MAQSGQSNRPCVCPLLDQSEQTWILARDGLSAYDRGCVKTVLHAFWRKIDSNGMSLAHERFAKAAGSILLLRADNCWQRFYTA
jgi:hypothetical protein